MANVKGVEIRGEVRVTVSIEVDDAPDVKIRTRVRKIRPERVIASYTYVPQGFDPDGRVYFDREISVRGREVLKGGALGKHTVTSRFYSWDERDMVVPDWITTLVDQHRPDWDALVMPEMTNPTD